MQALRKDYERVVRENNELHQAVIAASEGANKASSSNYLLMKGKDDQIAELQFKVKQEKARNAELQVENSGLEERIDEIVRRSDKFKMANLDLEMPADGAAKAASVPGTPPRGGEAPLSALEKKTYDLVKAADQRMEEVEADLREAKGRVARLEEDLRAAGAQVESRDREIARLSKVVEENVNLDRLSLEQKNQESADKIEALHQQLELITSQVKDNELRLAEKTVVERALAASEQEKNDLATRLQEAVEENESIQKNLKKLQLQLKQLKALHASAGIVVNPSDGAVVADVSFDQTPQVQQMKEEILALHSANADLEAKYARAVQEFEALRAQASGDAAGDPTRALLQALTQELQHYKDAVFRMQAEVESTNLKFLELQQREQRALEAGGAAADVAAKVEGLEATVVQLEQAAQALDEERQSLRLQLRESSESRLRASAAYQAAEEECRRLQKELQDAQAQLAALRDNVGAAAERSAVGQAELAKLQTELAEAQAKSRFLEGKVSDLENASSQADVSEQQRISALHDSFKKNYEGVIDSLHAKLHEATTAFAAKDAEHKKAADLAAQKQNRIQILSQESLALQSRVRESEGKNEGLLAQLQSFEGQTAQITSTISTLKAERDELRQQLAAAEANTAGLLQTSQKAALQAADASSGAFAKDTEIGALKRQLLARANEAELQAAKVKELQEGLAVVKAGDGELRAQLALERNRAVQLKAQLESLAADRSSVEGEVADAQSRVAGLIQDLSTTKSTLARKTQELEQLKALITQLDCTRDDLVGRLRASRTEAKAAALKAAQLEDERARDADTIGALREEVKEVKSVLQAVDGEKDRLVATLDKRTEEVAAITHQTVAEKADLKSRADEVAHLEGQLAKAERRAQEAAAEAKALAEQCAGAQAQKQEVLAKLAAAQGEVQALSEDLAQMTREQQVVNADLVRAVAERGAAKEGLQAAHAKLTAAERLVQAKEREAQELTLAYQELGAESRRLDTVIAGLEREGAEKETRLAVQAAELASTMDALRQTEAENRQYVTDLQAFERQSDSLTRALSGAETKADSGVRERAALLEQLQVAKQTVLQLERARSGLQRDLASAEAHAEILKSRVGEGSSEAENLLHKVHLEQKRVFELEGLLAAMRAREHQAATEGQRLGTKSSSLLSKNQLMEEQIVNLEQQVAAMTAAREAQDRELARLSAGGAPPGPEVTLETEVVSPTERQLFARAERAEKTLVDNVAALQRLQGENAQLTDANAALEAAAAARAAEVADLQATLHAAEARYEEVKAELALVQAEATQIRDALQAAAAARGAGELVSGETLVREQVARAQLEEVEKRAALLDARLASAGRDGAESSAALDAAHHEIEDLRTDNARLLDLVARLDEERGQLQQEMAALEAQAASRSPGGSPPGGAATPPRPAGSPSPARSPSSVALQGQLQALKAENDRLKSNLEVTQATVGKMGDELTRVRAEYQAAASELSADPQ